jgi:hypothetical protein
VPYLSLIWSYTTSNTIVLKDAFFSIGKAATGTSLVRVILKSYGKEILKFVSNQFLDLVVGVQL